MILVTGGSGLVGSALITQLLAKGEKVIATYNKTALPSFGNSLLQQVPCNILDPVGLEEVMQGVQQVYHCAAIVSFNPARKQELFKVNIEGTANVVNAALTTGVKKLVHVSSVAALGRAGGKPISEKDKWNEKEDSSNYGKSKYYGEMEVWRGIGEGLQAVIVNPSLILGGGDWNAGSSKIFKSVYDGFPWYSTGVNGFTDVRDVAKAMILLMESDITAQHFIISAENKSYHQVFSMIAEAFNKKAPYKKVTPFLAGLIWRLEAIKSMFTKQDPLVTKETADTALANIQYDNSKLLQYLPGFTYIDFRKTINDTCTALQQKLNSR